VLADGEQAAGGIPLHGCAEGAEGFRCGNEKGVFFENRVGGEFHCLEEGAAAHGEIWAGGQRCERGDDGLGFVGVAFREMGLLRHLVQGEAGDAPDIIEKNLAAWRGGVDGEREVIGYLLDPP